MLSDAGFHNAECHALPLTVESAVICASLMMTIWGAQISVPHPDQ